MIKPILVAIAEDHLLFRQGIVTMLSDEENIKVLFDVANGQELLDNLKDKRPDVILLDIRMPVMNGEEALEYISGNYPDIKVIVISMHYSDHYITHFIKNGARGFLPKNCPIESVIDAIIAVHNHGYYFDNKVSRSMITELLQTKKIPQVELTDRELLIIKLLCDEKSTAEIGEQLLISNRTVEWHKKNIFDKTSSKSLAGLAIYAIKHKIINNPEEGFD